MNEMIERAARASFAYWKQQNSIASNFEDLNPVELEFAYGHARAVIETLREPTEAMMDAGYNHPLAKHADTLQDMRRQNAKNFLNAMIDVALK